MGRTPSTTHRRHFCRALYLQPSDKKLCFETMNGVFREIKEIKEIREYRVLISFGRVISFGFNSKRLLKFLMFPKFLKLSIAPLFLH